MPLTTNGFDNKIVCERDKETVLHALSSLGLPFCSRCLRKWYGSVRLQKFSSDSLSFLSSVEDSMAKCDRDDVELRAVIARKI